MKSTKTTLTGTMIVNRTPRPKGGRTYTLTSRDRKQSVTWTNYEEFHTGSTETYQNVTITIEVDTDAARNVPTPGSHSHGAL